MHFVDDTVLVAKNHQNMNDRLEEWRSALECKGLWIGRSKTECLHCNFSKTTGEEDIQINIK